MSSPACLRPAALPDVGAIAEFQTACWREAYRGLVPNEYLDRVSVGDRQERWRDRLTSGARRIALAEVAGREGDELVGVVSWAPPALAPAAAPTRGPDPTAGEPAPTLELMSLYVAAHHSGTGIAATLLGHALGARPARLWVFEDNPRALAFYAKHGFAPDGHRQVDPDTGVWERRLARRAQAPVSPAG
ncbi:GNAT family N-acetyltransferase [Pengzhenrongella sp.]|uniref:GNAT family N-acetyltransferase n=1 Tax=Pengzhenrongella sp. TaxID=2888820 RepID=UPI002F95AC2E